MDNNKALPKGVMEYQPPVEPSHIILSVTGNNMRDKDEIIILKLLVL